MIIETLYIDGVTISAADGSSRSAFHHRQINIDGFILIQLIFNDDAIAISNIIYLFVRKVIIRKKKLQIAGYVLYSIVFI